MRRRSFLSRYETLALLALLLARVCCASALPQQKDVEPPRSGAYLRFGQFLALADFDGDDHLDKATLGGVGRNKSIEVFLSQTKSHTLLRFDTLTNERGSLFTGDIDNDGDDDLVWSDLIHPDDVVIWLDDGGRFERVCPDKYAKNFVLADASALGDSEIPHQDFAFSPRHDPSLAFSSAHDTGRYARTPIFSGEWRRVPVHAGILGPPFDRGPPFLLS